jgi:plasmid maintenance system antidote protein VapI
MTTETPKIVQHARKNARLIEVRRQNFVWLSAEHDRRMRESGFRTGIQVALARALDCHPTLITHLKTGRSITDPMARRIEQGLEMPVGWLDIEHAETQPPKAMTVSERQFVDLCLRAHRAATPLFKRELSDRMKRWLEFLHGEGEKPDRL